MSKQKMLLALDVAGRACTEAAVSEIELLLRSAQDAADVTFKDITPADVADIKKTDTLVRLQRNAMALRTLLDQARDTAIYMRQEIATIMTAEIESDNNVKARQKAALQRELKRKYNEKQRQKEEEQL
jgi:hypothetical protein